jgi:hypothetical protein
MRLLLLGLALWAVLALPASAAFPATKLTITTRLEGGYSPLTYTLTCGPASVRGVPPGTLKPLDACRALALAGERLHQPRLSVRIEGCEYFVAPRRAVITGYRSGKRVRTFVEVGGCERLLVPLRVLDRFVVWSE